MCIRDRVNKDGQVDEHESRQHVCTNNLVFRKKVYQLTKKIAAVANDFDNIVAIQIDNEFKCHVDQCFCESCKKLWPRWLKEKYGIIENLNKSWGTNLWLSLIHIFYSWFTSIFTICSHLLLRRVQPF